jgi:hypothetical protein
VVLRGHADAAALISPPRVSMRATRHRQQGGRDEWDVSRDEPSARRPDPRAVHGRSRGKHLWLSDTIRRITSYTRRMELRERLLGSWRPVSWDWRDERGDVESPLGQNPIGLLMYDDAGTVSAQLMRPNQPSFVHDDWRQASDEEKASAWIGYFCYFGTFSVDEEAGIVTHHVEGSWFPNLVGTDQVRQCTLTGDRLSLSAETEWGRVTIVWLRTATPGPSIAERT